jgi:pyridoxamine 5'-phosphate oxidase
MDDLRSHIVKLREDFTKGTLSETDVNKKPDLQFELWLQQAVDSKIEEFQACNLSTVSLQGKPTSRIVYLREFQNNDFFFYTNYNSEKGKAISVNPNVCLSFFWHAMERQVIIKGIAEKTLESVSDTYFDSRPDGSKLGALVSPQSEIIPSRDFLEHNLKTLEKEFHEKEIPRPKNWGGFLVRPIEVEFWQGRPNRLHDRIRYQLQKDCSWNIDRLSP